MAGDTRVNVMSGIVGLLALALVCSGPILSLYLYREGRKILENGIVVGEPLKRWWPEAERALAKPIGYFTILCAGSALLVSAAFLIQMIVSFVSS